jgi:phosphatidylglycerophosphate synthase
VITLLRFGLSLFFFVLAAVKMNPKYNYIGLVIHWLGDFSDGFFARTFKQETIFGDEIDIIADRVGFLFFYVIYLMFNPQVIIPVAILIINFSFLDFYLSNQFLKYNIISINYFYKVDRMVHKLNFSTVGKFCNTVIVTLSLIFLPQLWIFITIYALGLVVVKSYSIFLLSRIK